MGRAFLLVYEYVTLPAVIAFSIAAALLASTYCFKGALFLMTSWPTTDREPSTSLAQAFAVVTHYEVIAGFLFLFMFAGCDALYRYTLKRQAK